MAFWDRWRRPSIEDATVDTNTTQKDLSKAIKVKALSVDAVGRISSGRSNFEESPYDFIRIKKAYQTDSIVKAAISKYNELMWKGGYELVSENPAARVYLQQRLDLMSIFMNKPFEQFLEEITEDLFLYHNSYIVKARGDLTTIGRGIRAQGVFGEEEPVIGYYLLPVETIKISRDKHNIPKKYQQDISGSGGATNKAPEWKPEEVVHLAYDRRKGTLFGEPFVQNVLEDLMALRQMEEDVLNLTHRELWPLTIYSVGTDTFPAEDGEVEAVASDMEEMRTDSGLVIPWRHSIEIKGGEGKALQANEYLQYFRQRVVVGLGISEIHLGISEVANRSVSERLDIALYDRIKHRQRFFARYITQFIFNELLLEGGFDPYETPLAEGDSDRVYFRFKEIDTETQIKRENNAAFKWVSNLTTHDEARQELGMDPLSPEEEKRLYYKLIEIPLAEAGSALTAAGGTTQKGQAQSNSPNQTKPKSSSGAASKNQPQNQHGKRTAPRVSHGLSSPPPLMDAEGILGDIIAGEAKDLEQELCAYVLEATSEALLSAAVKKNIAYGLPSGWEEEVKGAIYKRVRDYIFSYQRSTQVPGMEPEARDALLEAIDSLLWRSKQAARLYAVVLTESAKVIRVTTISTNCPICDGLNGQEINKNSLGFDRVLASVHQPCELEFEGI